MLEYKGFSAYVMHYQSIVIGFDVGGSREYVSVSVRLLFWSFSIQWEAGF